MNVFYFALVCALAVAVYWAAIQRTRLRKERETYDQQIRCIELASWLEDKTQRIYFSTPSPELKIDEVIMFLQEQRAKLGNVSVRINVLGSGPRRLTGMRWVTSVIYGPDYHLPKNERPPVPYVEFESL
jgi:hypothetical protein